MIYAYDQNVQLPVKDLYDNLVVAMSIAAAKDMYEKGLLELKDFKKEFGDFYSPFLKDMLRYGLMILGVKDVINNLYANGIDPVRNPAGRAAISRAISNIDPAEFNNMRANAKTGLAYQEAMLKLMVQGKYDPMMQDYYLRSQGIPSFLDFSSAGGNTWTQVSPMEAINLRDLTAPGFAHRTAHELTKEQAQKWMGKSYDPRAKYTGFTYDDVYDTAGTLVPGLRGDWRAEYFKDISRLKALAQNPNATQADIDRLFLRDIAEANKRWIINPTGNINDWVNEQKLGFERERLNLERMRVSIARQNAASRAARGGSGSRTSTSNGSGNTSQKGQFDYQDFLIGTTAANVLGKTSVGMKIGVGGVSDYTPEKVSGFMGAAQKELAENTYNYNFTTPSKSSLGLSNKSFNMSDYIWDKQRNKMLNSSGGLIDIGSQYGKTFNLGARDMNATDLDTANKNFLSQISVPSSPEHFVQWTQRKADSDNSDYVLMNLGADKGRIYSADEVALTAAGVNRPKDVPAALEKTKRLRKNLESRFIDGKTMMKSEGFVLGRVGNDGAHHIFQKIRIVNKNKFKDSNNGDLQDYRYNNLYNEGEVIYYDMGADTQGNPNYSMDFMENMNPVVTDQSLGSDRNVLKSLGLSSTNVKSDNSVPYLDYSSDEEFDDDLLDLMGY